MENLWTDAEAKEWAGEPLKLRSFTSQLLGRNPDLVLHGGGNTSVKITEKNIYGEDLDILYVKGSGWDLKSILPAGFAPVKLKEAQRLATLPTLTDTDMVRELKAAMINPSAPGPSVEAILHAIIPHKYVDHTHADAVVTITNSPGGDKTIAEVMGEKVLILPYVMPGFILAKQVHEATKDLDWSKYEGIVLLGHGVFSFDDDAKKSYDNMINMVTRAEEYLNSKGVNENIARQKSEGFNPVQMAELRKLASKKFGASLILKLNDSDEAAGYSAKSNVTKLGNKGPLTPDHVIHTKRVPVFLGKDFASDLDKYEKEYAKYYDKNKFDGLTILDPVPRYAIWPSVGYVAIGANASRSNVIYDIVEHTVKSVQWAEKLGDWIALPEKDIFDVEYWELEQAKLKKSGAKPEFEGQIAMVTGAASGIGKAIAEDLLSKGACVVALDINPKVENIFKSSNSLGLKCDIGNLNEVKQSLEKTIKKFGGLDIFVMNAGIFPEGHHIEEISDEEWDKVINLNLSAQMKFLREATPYLKRGWNPSVIVIASKNVPAPGPGVSAYSVSKAGLTQLARVAALELGQYGIRVNTLHPNAVFDTGIWTEEVLKSRAKHYGLTVDEYKRNNVLKVEVTSKDVARLVSELASETFHKTTGAQIPVDGGNDRVI